VRLGSLTPDDVEPNWPCQTGVQAVTSTTITFKNTGGASESVTWRARRTWSAQQDTATPTLLYQGGLAAAGALRGPSGDYSLDSIVIDNTSAQEWGLRYAEVKQRPANAAVGGSALIGNYLNFDGASTGVGRHGLAFVVPAGVTLVTVDASMQLPTGVLSSKVGLRIMALDDTTVVASRSCVLTGVATSFTLPATVTPGLTYFIHLVFNDGVLSSAQAQAFVGLVKIRVTTGPATGVFSGSFARYPIYPWNMPDNLWDDQHVADVGLTWFTSGMAGFPMETDSEIAQIEYGSGGAVNNMYAWVNGFFLQEVVAAATTFTLGLTALTLPAGDKSFIVRSSFLNGTQGFGPSGVGGTFPRAVYVSSGSASRPVFAQQPRRLMIVGDSTEGASSDEPGLQGVGPIRRTYFPGDTIIDAWGNRTMSSITASLGGNPDAAQIADYVNRVLRAKVTDLYIALGINDFIYAGTAPAPPLNATVAAFQTGYTAFIARMTLICPNVRIYLQSPLATQNEAAVNGVGETVPQYRTAVAAVAATNTATCTYVNGLPLLAWNVNNFATAYHPSTNGYGLLAYAIRTAVGF
jgi:hypothetical protein